MRRFDKKDNIRKANLLAEQRHLKTKGLVLENNDTYFETLSSALDVVREKAQKLGLQVNEDDMWTNFGTGGIPYETTKTANISLLQNGEPILDKRGKEANRYLRVSIYRMSSGKYELTTYKTW
jgi:predicted transcriptional regulator